MSPVTREREPYRTGISMRNGGSMATGEMSITSTAAPKVQIARIAPNWRIGITLLVTSAP